MKAYITSEGILRIESESSTETYALKQWINDSKLAASNRVQGDTSCYRADKMKIELVPGYRGIGD